MFEPQDKDGREESRLSLGRAIQEERARLGGDEAPPRAPETEAAARHRLARSRREARQGALMSALATQPPPEPGTAEPEEPVAGKPSRLRDLAARFRGRREKPAPEPEPKPEPSPEPVPTPAAPREPRVGREDVRLAPVAPPAGPAPDSSGGERWQPLIDPHMIVGRIANSKLLIASTTLVGALLGVAIALSTPRHYDALAEVLIDPRDLKIVEREITAPGLPSEATLAIIENQARILTSGPVLAKVVEKLNLVSDPEFNGQGGSRFTDLLNPIALVRSLLSRSDAPDNSRIETRAAVALADKVTVERTGKTFILNVNVATEDAEKSALIANTLVDSYIEAAGRLQSETAGRATTELTSRLEELRRGVEQAEDRVETFKAENDIVDPQGRSIADDEIVKLNDQLSVARARTLELDSKAASARQLDVNSVVSGGLPEGTSSSVLTELRAQYASIKQAVDNAAVRLGPRHPQRQALEAQLEGARDQISAELRRIVASLQVELRRAVELEQDLAARLAQLKVRRGSTNQDLVRLRELERDANSKRAVYESFLLRARETGEQQDINTANISVISRASAPLDPSGPSRAMIAGTGMVLGFMAGIGLAGLRGALDGLRASAAARRGPRRRDDDPTPERAADEPSTAQPPEPAATSSTETDEANMYARYPQHPAPQAGHSNPPAAAYQPAGHWQPGYPAAYPEQPAQEQPPQQAHWQSPPPAWPGEAPWAGYQPPHPGWPQPSPQGYPPQPSQQAYPQPQGAQQPYAPPPQAAQPDSQQSIRDSIEEIRAAVQECREAVRQLADKHSRRFF